MNRLISIAFGFTLGYLLQYYDTKKLRKSIRDLEKQKNDLESQLEAEEIEIEDEETSSTEMPTQQDSEATELKQQLAKTKLKLESALAENQSLKVMLDEKLASMPSDSSSSQDKVVLDKENIPSEGPKDNLRIIEGIGPEIEKLLNNAGIITFSDIANTPTFRLRDILVAGGERFRIHDPESWPQQAALARDGRMVELKELQQRLLGGKNP